MITAPYFGLGQDGELRLWCRLEGHDSEGRARFWVINGHWHGDYKDGIMRIEYTGEEHSVTLMWMGAVPFEDEDYNEAIEHIRSLNWRIEMKTNLVSFNEAIDEAKIVERNSKVLNLAAAHKRIAERQTKLNDQLAYLETLRADIENAGNNVDITDPAEIEALLIKAGQLEIDISVTKIRTRSL